MLARPQTTVTHVIRISATRVARRTETVYADVTGFDLLRHTCMITSRQHQAASRLYSLYVSAGLLAHTIQAYRTAPEIAEDEADAPLEPIDTQDGESQRDACRRAYRHLLRDAGPRRGPALDGLMAGGRYRFGDMVSGLEWLVTQWGL